MLGQHVELVALHRGVESVLSMTIRIGDTKYHMQCTYVIWVRSNTPSKMVWQDINPNGNPH